MLCRRNRPAADVAATALLQSLPRSYCCRPAAAAAAVLLSQQVRAQRAPLLDPQQGLEGGSAASCCLDAHRHISIQGLHSLQEPAMQASGG